MITDCALLFITEDDFDYVDDWKIPDEEFEDFMYVDDLEDIL